MVRSDPRDRRSALNSTPNIRRRKLPKHFWPIFRATNTSSNQKDKRRAVERAITRSHGPEALAIAGVIFRDCDRYGKPKASLANAVIAIRALGIDARHDLFHHRIDVTYKGDAKTIHEGLLTDDTISAVRSLINNTYRDRLRRQLHLGGDQGSRTG